jgi:rubrerythrin
MMVTFVGTQADFGDALKDLIELDYDAVEAYEAAVNRLENQVFKEKLNIFKADHEWHIQELTNVLNKRDIEPPSGPSAGKQWLAKGKVVLANLIGDTTILRAMISNEIDTNSAYERISLREDMWPEAKDIVRRGLEDERRHKKWLENTLLEENAA